MTFHSQPPLEQAPPACPITNVGLLWRGLPSIPLIVPGGALTEPGTSSGAPGRVWGEPFVHEPDSTNSGTIAEERRPEAPEATRRAVAELRRLSGLTWEQLAQLFGVSRRSVHFWASGKPLSAANEERLLRVLDVVREADRGDARSTRAALLDVTQGRSPLELLAAQRFDDARALVDAGPGRRQPALAPLSAAARDARRPPPPEDLVDAEHDRIHRDTGRARPVRTVRSRRRERS